MRQPIAHKTHYPNGVTLLDKKFDEIFSHEKGPGDLPSKKQLHSQPAQGVVVPHASYDVAGPAMAWSYATLASHPLPDVFILVAQAQKQQGSGLSMQTFRTPYGEARVDQHFARALMEHKNITQNEELHDKESLIEIQLPFLQYIARPHAERMKILPLIVDEDVDLAKFCVDIKETLLDQDKSATFIFISNLTSYGRSFNYVPYTEDIRENISTGDAPLLKALRNMDYTALKETLDETMIPLSGLFPLKMMIQYFGTSVTPELEQYYLSADITNEFSSCVSFASLILR